MENTNINNNEEIEIDLGELFRAIWSKIWIVIAVTVVCAALVGNITYFFIEPTYTATSRVYLLPREGEAISQTELQIGTQMTNDAAKLATSKSVINPVLKDLKLNMDYEALSRKVSVNNPTDTRLIDISVRDADPQMAADISNALADSLCDQVATIMKTDRPTIAERAVSPDKPSAPSMKKNVVIAALLGLLGSIAVIAIRYILDDTIKTAEDVEKYLQLNTLASIPMEYSEEENTKTRRKRKKKANA